MEIAQESTPISQGRSLQKETVSTSRDYSLEGFQVHEPLLLQGPPEPTSRSFPLKPGYYLPSFIEKGDPMGDDKKLKFNLAPAVGYKSYGRVPVELSEHPSSTAEGTNAKSIPLTASYNAQQQWWDDIPNEEIPRPGRLRLTASNLQPSKSDFDKYLQEQDTEHETMKCRKDGSTPLVGFDDSTSLISGLLHLWPSPSPTRQMFGGLPLMSPFRQRNMHPSDQASLSPSHSNLGKSPRHQSDLDSIAEDQQLSVKGKLGVAGSLEQRRAKIPGATPTAESVSRHVLKRAASENLRRNVVPYSPLLKRVVEPFIPLSGETSKVGRPLNPDAEPYIRDPTWSSQPISAAANALDLVRVGPAFDSQAGFQALAHTTDGKHIYGYQAESRTRAQTDHSSHAHTSEQHILLHSAVPPSGTTMISSDTPAPVWTQQDHPHSWRARIASGDTVLIITQDAYGLLTVLDPISYSLPYGSIVFGIKSTSETNVRASMQHGVWCSTGMGNNTLQRAWNQLGRDGQRIVLLFSVSGSQKYCGMAEMSGPVDADARPGIWTDGNFRGALPVRWIVCKDVTFVLFQDMLNPHNNNLPVTTLRDVTALPETLGRKVIQTYFEAPHFVNILLRSTQEAPAPGSIRHVLSIQLPSGPTAQSVAAHHQDTPLNVPLSIETRLRHGRQYTGRRPGYTPRVVGATNVQHAQPVPIKTPGLPLSPGHTKPSRPGRVPGATNDTIKSGRIVGATDSGHDVDSESDDDVFYRPGQDR